MGVPEMAALSSWGYQRESRFQRYRSKRLCDRRVTQSIRAQLPYVRLLGERSGSWALVGLTTWRRSSDIIQSSDIMLTCTTN